MKSGYQAVFICCILSSCSTPPLTQEELLVKTAWREAALSCVQKGWTTYLPELTTYIGDLGAQIGAGASSQRIQEASQRVNSDYPGSNVRRENCRSLDMWAVQHQQANAEQQRQAASFQASMDHLGSAADSIQQSTAFGGTSCQYYEWGNMVSCY